MFPSMSHRAPHKIRILFDANPLMTSRTGVGQYTARLIESIAAGSPDTIELVGYYYNFLKRKQPPASPTAQNISYRPIYHAPGPAVNALRRLGLQVPIEFLTFLKPDFVLYPNFLSQPSIFRVPSAIVVHDLMFYEFPEYGSDKNVRDLQRFVPQSIHRSRFVISVSAFTAQRLGEIYHTPAHKILVTSIPPRPNDCPTQAAARRTIAQAGIDKPYLFFIGTMEPRKNLIALMTAYSKLPAKLRNTHSLVLAGKMDWKFQAIKAKLEELRAAGCDIRYLGYVDDNTETALYTCARLVVVSSHYEGFGMQINDALSRGVPVAVSDIPVFHESGGDLAAYFDQNDPEAIAATITRCLQTPPPDPKQLIRHVASKPSWRDESSQVLKRIKQSISQKGKS